MPQLHSKAQEHIYLDILKWKQQDIITNYKNTTILMGADLQATHAKENMRLYYLPLNYFCETTGLTQVTPKDTYTFIPAITRIDHWPPATTNHAILHATQHNYNSTHPGVR